MESITALLDRLERIQDFPPNSDVAYTVEDGAPNSELKRSVQARASLASMRARGAIEGNPRFTDPDGDVIPRLLEVAPTDPEGRDYIELAELTERLIAAVNVKALEASK